MPISLTNSVQYLDGVGPQRAATLEARGIITVGDLLSYLPFRYEDRLRFTPIAEIIPGQVQTIFAEVTGGGGTTVRFQRSRRSIFHVAVRDASGTVYVRFFHGGYLEGRPKTRPARKSGRRPLPPWPPGNGQPPNGIRRRQRRWRRRFHRSRPHRPHLRSHRRNQLSHAAPHHLPRARQFRRQYSRTAPAANSRTLSLPRAPRSPALRALPSAGPKHRVA